MRGLYYAHSGLRFLVLLAAAVAIVWFLVGLASRRAPGRDVRVLGGTFVGLLDLQILLGLGLLYLHGWTLALLRHGVLMLLAATDAHVLLVLHRRRGEKDYVLPLVAVLGAAILIVIGIMMIRSSPFATKPFH